MRYGFRIAALVLFAALGLVGLVLVTPAYAAEVNFGGCMSYLATTGQNDLLPYQAPGQSGNGPYNGNSGYPPAFNGGQGC